MSDSKTSIRFTVCRKVSTKDLSLVLTNKGQRTYKVITLSRAIDLKYWSKKEGKFLCDSDEARENNVELSLLLRGLNDCLANNTSILTAGGLYKFYIDCKNSIVAKANIITVGNYVENHIELLKTGKNSKNPSTNFRRYITLRNTLQKEGNIYNMSISKVNYETYLQFAKWIPTRERKAGKGCDYENLMKSFKCIMHLAYKERLIAALPAFDIAENAPKILPKKKAKTALTKEEYEAFINIDLSIVKSKVAKDIKTKRLFMDFFILMYELQTRPNDLVMFHSEDIYLNSSGCLVWDYLPKKKWNNKGAGNGKKNAITPITPRAAEIIKHYANESKAGYIFPF